MTGVNYDPPAALEGLKVDCPEWEEVLETEIPRAQARIGELAAMFGSPVVTRLGETCAANLGAIANVIRQALGVPGDRKEQFTLYAALNVAGTLTESFGLGG